MTRQQLSRPLGSAQTRTPSSDHVMHCTVGGVQVRHTCPLSLQLFRYVLPCLQYCTTVTLQRLARPGRFGEFSGASTVATAWLCLEESAREHNHTRLSSTLESQSKPDPGPVWLSRLPNPSACPLLYMAINMNAASKTLLSVAKVLARQPHTSTVSQALLQHCGIAASRHRSASVMHHCTSHTAT